MLTVSHVADRYGVTTTFMVRALDQIGCRNMRPDSALSAATIAQFESAFGEKIRTARPKSSADAADHDLPLRTARPGPKPHVMRIAHEHHTGKRRNGYFEKVLLDEPGTLHAIDAHGTREGDPWRGEETPGQHSFFEHNGPHAACGKQVKAVLGDRFDPENMSANICPRCVELVAAGKGFRDSPWEREAHRTYFCEAYLRLRIDGRVVVEQCRLQDLHSGPHRTSDGATWDIGVDDYVPVSEDSNRRITEAS